MALPAVPNTDVGMYNHLRESTDCSQTTNLSLKSLLSGDAGGDEDGSTAITNTFGAAGGKAESFDLIGGSNNPLQSTADSANLYDDDIGTAPFHMSHTIGGKYT